MGKPLIFLSSTSDMEEERKAIGSDADLSRGYEIYRFEEDRSRGQSPKRRCGDVIKRSDIFLCLVGSQFGSPLPDTEKSIVQWEYETAVAQRDKKALLFFLHEDVQREELDPRQRLFVEELTSFDEGHWCKFFADQRELVREVRNSLDAWLREFFLAVQRRRAEAARRNQTILTGIVGSVLTLFLVLLVLQLTLSVMTNAAVIAVCSSVAAVGGFGTLMLKLGGLTHDY